LNHDSDKKQFDFLEMMQFIQTKKINPRLMWAGVEEFKLSNY